MPNFTITNLINQGTINFHNNNLTIDRIHTVSSSEEIDDTFHMNFLNDLKSVEKEIQTVKQQTKTYKETLDMWITQENTELNNMWAKKRNPSLLQHLQKLSEWTGKVSSTIIFDSQINESFESSIIQKASTLKNIMFIVETDGGNMFGSYHTVIPNKVGKWAVSDDKHFVFTLKNPYETQPMKFRPIVEECYPLWFYKSSTSLYSVQSFCHITTNKQCYIAGKHWSGKAFSDVYNDISGKDCKIFTKTQYPMKFGMKRLVVLTWN